MKTAFNGRSFVEQTLVATASVFALVLLACPRPPVERTADASVVAPPGKIAVDLALFYNDRYALSHKWYDYGDGHVLSPKDEVYVVVDRAASATAFHALEILSYYDASSGESGFFTIAVAHWQGSTWGSAQQLVLSHTIKAMPPICVDLAALAEADCAGNGWQVMFTGLRYLAPGSLHPVSDNPSLLLRSTSGQLDRGQVKLAVVAAADLASLTTDPGTIGDLVEAAPAEFWNTEFDHAQFAGNLPLNGMSIGRTWLTSSGASTRHVYFLRTMDMKVVKVAFETPTPGLPLTTVDVRFLVAIDEGEGIVDLAGLTAQQKTLPLPVVYGVRYLNFSADPPLAELSGDQIHAPPLTSDWDLAFEVTQAGVQILVSPASVVLDWTADPETGNGSTDFDAASPPPVAQ